MLSQQIKQIESEVSELQAKGLEAEVLLEYKSIKSTVNGMVFDMKPRNIGFVAQSNFTIMKIVPFNKLEADVTNVFGVKKDHGHSRRLAYQT